MASTNFNSEDGLIAIKLSIVDGNIAVIVDAPMSATIQNAAGRAIHKVRTYSKDSDRDENIESDTHICLFIASGDENLPYAEREYISLCVNEYGKYLIKGYSSFGQVADDSIELEDKVSSTPDFAKKRYTMKLLLPFYLLPPPGEREDNPMALLFALNIVLIKVDQKSEIESISSLCTTAIHTLDDASIFEDPTHQYQDISIFEPLQLNDEETLQLRSLSRVSMSFAMRESMYGGDASDDSSSMSSSSNTTRTTTFVRTGDMLSILNFYKNEMENKYAMPPERQEGFQKLLTQMKPVLHEDEEVVYFSFLRYLKNWSWSHKKVILVMTNAPRLLVVDESSEMRNLKSITINWSMKNTLNAEMVSEYKFYIQDVDNNTHHFFDKELYKQPVENTTVSLKWCTIIKKVNSYLSFPSLHFYSYITYMANLCSFPITSPHSYINCLGRRHMGKVHGKQHGPVQKRHEEERTYLLCCFLIER